MKLQKAISGRARIRALVPFRRFSATCYSEATPSQPETRKSVHFVGVGGSTLGPLAMLAASKNWRVSGSDQQLLEATHKVLEHQGIKVLDGHSSQNIVNDHGADTPDVVVVSGDVSADNPELEAAWDLGIPVFKRSKWLELFTADYSVIAVSGTHGKTTTTAMLALMLQAAGEDVVAVVGTDVPGFTTGCGALVQPGTERTGKACGLRQRLVIAADDHDGAFLGLRPSILVVTSVELDHLDLYNDAEAVQRAFASLATRVEPGGVLLLCADDKGCAQLLRQLHQDPRMHPNTCTIFTYGCSKTAHWQATSTRSSPQGTTYNLTFRGTPVTTVRVPLPGTHNVLNSVAAVAASALACTETHLLATQAIDVTEVVDALMNLPDPEGSLSPNMIFSEAAVAMSMDSRRYIPNHYTPQQPPATPQAQTTANSHPMPHPASGSTTTGPTTMYTASSPSTAAGTQASNQGHGQTSRTQPTAIPADDISGTAQPLDDPVSFFKLPGIKLPPALEQVAPFAAAAEAANKTAEVASKTAAVSMHAAQQAMSTSVEAAMNAMSDPVYAVASAVDNASSFIPKDLTAAVPERASQFISSMLKSRSTPPPQGSPSGSAAQQQQRQATSNAATGSSISPAYQSTPSLATAAEPAAADPVEPSTVLEDKGWQAMDPRAPPIVAAESRLWGMPKQDMAAALQDSQMMEQAAAHAGTVAAAVAARLQREDVQKQRKAIASQVEKMQDWLRGRQREVQQQLQSTAKQWQREANTHVSSAAQQLQEAAQHRFSAAGQEVKRGAGRIMQEAQQMVFQLSSRFQAGPLGRSPTDTTTLDPASSSTALATTDNSSMLMVAIQQVQEHLAESHMNPGAASNSAPTEWSPSEAQQYRAQLWKVLQESAAHGANTLQGFPGLPRRLQHVAEVQVTRSVQLQLYDDRAHHPTSIRSCLTGARQVVGYECPIWVVFQPCSYARLQRFLMPFSVALGIADKVFVTDVQPSAAKEAAVVHATDLVVATSQRTDCAYVGSPAAALNLLTADILRHAALHSQTTPARAPGGMAGPQVYGSMPAEGMGSGQGPRYGPAGMGFGGNAAAGYAAGEMEGAEHKLVLITISVDGMEGLGERLVANLGSIIRERPAGF